MPHTDSVIALPGRTVELKVHRCNWSGGHAENSLAAVEECAREGVLHVEIDVQALRDRDFVVFHDDDWERGTTATGHVRDSRPADLARIRFRRGGAHPALLSEIVDVVSRYELPRWIELDLKDQAPLPWPRVEELARIVQPAKSRLLFGTTADWNLRRLLAVDPSLEVSLNPHGYLDVGGGELPRGAYGYRDAHPLARRRLTPVGDYLRDRLSGVMRLVPGAREAHVSLRMFEKMLRDGVSDAAEIFHGMGIRLDVWTLDAGMARWEERLSRLLAAGVDVITTNTPHELAAAARRGRSRGSASKSRGSASVS